MQEQFNIPMQPASSLKASIIACLAWLFAWHPPTAVTLSYVVTGGGVGFRRRDAYLL